MKKFIEILKMPFWFMLSVCSYKYGLEEDYIMLVEERADYKQDGSWTDADEKKFQEFRKEALKGLGKKKVADIDRNFGVA